MAAWPGKFQYLDADGAPLSQGACQFQLDPETALVIPSGGTPIAFDLGDVDRVRPGDWDLQLALYTGQTIVLNQFGAGFSGMTREFVAAWRDRTVQCLLLEDLEELGRYDAAANGAPSEVRIFKSNLAVLPQAGLPLQWRLAEIDSLRFDEAAYQIVIQSNGERLVLGKLAKKTDEAMQTLSGAVDALHTHAAQTLHNTFPFLTPDALRRLQTVMQEGRSASLAELAATDARLPEALIACAVDAPLRPYFDALRERAAGPPFAGFKFTRPDETGETEYDAPSAERPEESAPLFFWFFFPLPGNLLAWEATTGGGRATYLFSTGGDLAGAVRRITRGLALINFRREPVYLPESSLEQQPEFHRYAIGGTPACPSLRPRWEQQPEFHRYAIGARKLADLRALRAAYAGRAIHSSVDAWIQQLSAIQ